MSDIDRWPRNFRVVNKSKIKQPYFNNEIITSIVTLYYYYVMYVKRHINLIKAKLIVWDCIAQYLLTGWYEVKKISRPTKTEYQTLTNNKQHADESRKSVSQQYILHGTYRHVMTLDLHPKFRYLVTCQYIHAHVKARSESTLFTLTLLLGSTVRSKNIQKEFFASTHAFVACLLIRELSYTSFSSMHLIVIQIVSWTNCILCQ